MASKDKLREEMIAAGLIPQPKTSKTKKVLTGAKNIGVGLLKSIGETVAGGTGLVESAMQATTKPLLKLTGRQNPLVEQTPKGTQLVQSGTFKPTTPGQKVGKFVGDVAQFALPATKGSTALNVLGKSLPKAGKLGVQALGQGLIGAGVEASKQGELNRNVATTGAISGALPLAGAAVSKVFNPERLMTKALGLTPTQTRNLDKIATTKFKGKPIYSSVADFANKKGIAGGREDMVSQAEELFTKALKSKKNVLQNITRKTPNVYDDTIAYLQRVYNKEGLNKELNFINKIAKKPKLTAVELDKIRKLVDDTLYGAAYSGDERIAQKGVQRLVDPIRKTLEKLDRSGKIKQTNTDIRLLRKLIGEKGDLTQSAKRSLVGQLSFRGGVAGGTSFLADTLMPGAGRVIAGITGAENLLLGVPQVSSGLAKGITKASATKAGQAIPKIVKPLVQGASREMLRKQ